MKSVLETKNGGIITGDNFINYFPSKEGKPILFTYISSSMWNVALELSF